MEEIIKTKRNERVLERLTEEFGEDFLQNNCKRINLYGAEEPVLAIFRNGIKNYLLQNGRKVPINFGQNGSYSIDVGFFLHVGYFKGINKDVNTFLQEV